MQNKYMSDTEIGVDEAGRGPLIGRVYAGAVILGKDFKLDPKISIIDSKKLSAKKRAVSYEWIKNNVAAWGVGYAEPGEIDSINILEATNLAMLRAVTNLKTNFSSYNNNEELIVDGIGWETRFPGYIVNSFVKGDATYLSIACASIIAKEYHDMHIKDICNNTDLNEKYDLLSNMGYGTKKHLAGIHTYGPCDYHRKSFRPIKQ